MSTISLIITIRNIQYYHPHFTDEQRLKEVKKFAQSHAVYKGCRRTPNAIDDIASLMVFVSDL